MLNMLIFFVWINSFDFYIKKLHPTLSKRKLLTVPHNGSADKNDGLLALAKISILSENFSKKLET